MIFSLASGLRFLIFLQPCLFMDRNATVLQSLPAMEQSKTEAFCPLKQMANLMSLQILSPEHECHKVEALLSIFYIGRELHLTSSSPQIAPAVRLLHAKTQFQINPIFLFDLLFKPHFEFDSPIITAHRFITVIELSCVTFPFPPHHLPGYNYLSVWSLKEKGRRFSQLEESQYR